MTWSLPPRPGAGPTGRPVSARQGRAEHLPRLPELMHVYASGGLLVGATLRGPLPLYRYAPVQAAVLTGQVIPFAARWPEHLKLLVYRYAPVPALLTQRLAPELLGDFGTHARDPDGLRPWDQLTYRGWPVYVCSLDRPGARPAGIIDSQFERVRLDVQELSRVKAVGQGP